MPQIFHPSTNTISKFSIFGALFIIIALAFISAAVQRSPYVTQAFTARDQPVQFSHAHHAGAMGIDCRYCHTTVEESNFAGIPPTKTCINCHSQIWADSPFLEPVRESFRTGKALQWTRVHDLPDFVYFNHSIHVKKGVACMTCHGEVNEMPLMWQTQSLAMEWCLDCHRNPAKYIRDRKEVFNMDWHPPANQLEVGKKLVQEYKIGKNLLDCSVCHR